MCPEFIAISLNAPDISGLSYKEGGHPPWPKQFMTFVVSLI
jgi:hypothetical protein